jgi:Uncharacterized conserved protein
VSKYENFSTVPFAEDKHRAAFLALLLAGVQRPLLGCAPLFLITASTPGTGKSQLEGAASCIVTGGQSLRVAYRDDPAEQDKLILSLLREGAPVVAFDNINGRFGGDSLCAALTSETYSGRVLGASKTTRLPTTGTLFIATGNNPQLYGDMPRRSIEIRLDAKCEQPELRQFERTLVEIATEKRLELLEAILSIVAALHNEKPTVGIQPMGGFETFSRTVAAPVKWLTGVDITSCKPEATADEGAALLLECLHAWRESFGTQPLSVQDALGDHWFKAWAAAQFGDRFGTVNTRSLGNFIAKSKNRVVEGLTFVQGARIHGRYVWRVAAC